MRNVFWGLVIISLSACAKDKGERNVCALDEDNSDAQMVRYPDGVMRKSDIMKCSRYSDDCRLIQSTSDANIRFTYCQGQ